MLMVIEFNKQNAITNSWEKTAIKMNNKIPLMANIFDICRIVTEEANK